jgi:cbb3-type cytochrome oxidase cytochrome c subunit
MSSSQRYEKFSTVFLLAGLGSLIIAFLVLGLAPASMTNRQAFTDLPAAVPENFSAYYKDAASYQKGLLRGRDHYIAEACWHCHSQYVRPVSNEALRYGPVSQAGEYQNVLNRPQLFGTRRVGPDLARESGKRTNDWHFAHLYNPKWVEPQSVMPVYSWYFEQKKKEGSEEMEILPKQEAIDLVAYLQWLGNQVSSRSGTTFDPSAIVMPPTE